MFDDDEDEAVWKSIADPRENVEIEIPSVPVPGESETDPEPEIDVPRDLLVTFWSLVVTLNLAVLAASVGPMLVYFRGQVRLGGGLFVLGVLGFAYAYYKYRRYLDRRRAAEATE